MKSPLLKFYPKVISFLSVFILTAAVSAFAMDEDGDELEMESKARQAHQLAASDMMYQNEEWKAIYYQNQQIIHILKQIRNSLDVIKTRTAEKTQS